MLGCPLKCYHRRAGFVERGSLARSTREARVDGHTLHVYAEGEERKIVFFRGVIDGEESETECDYFAGISLEIEVCKGMCDMHSDCTHTSLILTRQSKLSS